jgi:hypothetical protein
LLSFIYLVVRSVLRLVVWSLRSRDTQALEVMVKGAFIGFLPITRAFAKLLSVGWRSTGSSLVPGELRTRSGPGTEGDVLAPEPTQLSMETLVRSEMTPSERSVGPLSRLTRFQLLEGARARRRLDWELRRCACGSEKEVRMATRQHQWMAVEGGAPHIYKARIQCSNG